MAWPFVQYILEHRTDLKDSVLIAAVVIADIVHEDGTGYPGTKLLEHRTRKSKRQVHYLMAALKEKGVIEEIGRKPLTRGYVPIIRLKHAKAVAHFGSGKCAVCDMESVQSNGESVQSNGESVQSEAAAYKEGNNKNSKQDSQLKRGCRLPDDFNLSDEMVAWAKREFPGLSYTLETEKFRDHWRSAAGKNAVKVNWESAWRNWMRRAAEYSGTVRTAEGKPAPRDSYAMNEDFKAAPIEPCGVCGRLFCLKDHRFDEEKTGRENYE